MIRAALVLLAGCDGVFGLHQVGTSTDAMRDTGADAATCRNGLNTDDFTLASDVTCTNGQGACGTWGYAECMGTNTRVDNGALAVTPDGTASATHGGCISAGPEPLDGDGVFMEVSAVGVGTGEYTGLKVMWTDGGAVAHYGMLGFGTQQLYYDRDQTTIAMMPYDAIAMRWWRVRARADGQAMIAEYSPDGRAWQPLAEDVIAAPVGVRFEIMIGTYQPEATASTLRVERINLCP